MLGPVSELNELLNCGIHQSTGSLMGDRSTTADDDNGDGDDGQRGCFGDDTCSLIRLRMG